MQEIEPPPPTTLRPLSVSASLFVLPSVPSVPLSLFRPPIYVSSYLVPPIPATHSLSSFLVSPGYTSPGRGYSVLSVTHARAHTHSHVLRHRYTSQIHERSCEIYVWIYGDSCTKEHPVCVSWVCDCGRQLVYAKVYVTWLHVRECVRAHAHPWLAFRHTPAFRLFSSRSRGLHTLNHPWPRDGRDIGVACRFEGGCFFVCPKNLS